MQGTAAIYGKLHKIHSGDYVTQRLICHRLRTLFGRRGSLGSLIWIDDSADVPVLYAWVDGGDGCGDRAESGGYARLHVGLTITVRDASYECR